MYERQLLLGSEHVDCFRRMRTSALFELLQVVSIRHTEELGMGREKTLDKGLLWVVARMHAQIGRKPEYDERITVRTWPGETMHVLFPRYYEILSEQGETIVRASAVWSLMDAAARSAVFPEEHGISIPGEERGGELPWLVPVRPLDAVHRETFSVPYSYVDINGHLNNTRYFDLAEDSIPAAVEGRPLREVTAEYNREVRLGETLSLAWGGHRRIQPGSKTGRTSPSGMGRRQRPVLRRRQHRKALLPPAAALWRIDRQTGRKRAYKRTAPGGPSFLRACYGLFLPGGVVGLAGHLPLEDLETSLEGVGADDLHHLFRRVHVAGSGQVSAQVDGVELAAGGA